MEFYNILVKWIKNKQQGKKITDYFKVHDYKTIAIYGMKELGERLVDELKESDVTIKYVIDKNPDKLRTKLHVLRPDDKLEEVDAIIVTAIHYFDEIENELSIKTNCHIISLEDVIYEI